MDVSLRETSICIVDEQRRIVKEGRVSTKPETIRGNWIQPGPVTKVFLRWDGPLPDKPVLPWLSSEPRRSFSYAGREGMLLATANAASWYLRHESAGLPCTTPLPTWDMTGPH